MEELVSLVEETPLLHLIKLKGPDGKLILKKKWDEVSRKLNELGPERSAEQWQTVSRYLGSGHTYGGVQGTYIIQLERIYKNCSITITMILPRSGPKTVLNSFKIIPPTPFPQTIGLLHMYGSSLQITKYCWFLYLQFCGVCSVKIFNAPIFCTVVNKFPILGGLRSPSPCPDTQRWSPPRNGRIRMMRAAA